MAYKVMEKQVLYDTKGKKTHVVLSYKRYEELLALIEDAFDARAMKQVAKEPNIPWSEAKKKLRKK